MRKQLWSCAAAIILLPAGLCHGMDEASHPYAEPAPGYLRQFAQDGRKVFVLERYDADGKLVARTVETAGDVVIDSPVERTIAGQRIKLRGLDACPTPDVVYNRVQTWTCVDAARDYAEAIYNKRASVILCKTMLLSSRADQPVPASCFLLAGGDGEPLRTINDDDSMVFLGLAGIGRLPDGRSRRPDLGELQRLSHAMGFQNAN